MHFRRAVALGNAESRVNLGLALEKSGQTSEARKVYEEAVALGSDGAMVDLGLLLLSQGDVDASLRVLEGAADLDSRWAWQLGDAYLAASEDESAASAYRRAISAGEKRAARDLAKLIDPADETTVRQLYVMSIEAGAVAAIAEYVEYLTARGHFAEAEEISLAAIRQGDSYVPLAYARLLATSHRYPEARAMYTRAASLGDDVSDEVGELA